MRSRWREYLCQTNEPAELAGGRADRTVDWSIAEQRELPGSLGL